MKWLLVVHLAATLFMAGVIWIVQVVHYPLFAEVGTSGFSKYAVDHARLITYVVLPAMFVELGTAIALASRPGGASGLAYTGLALIIIIWASTFFVQVPVHTKLAEGFDADAHRWLVTSNWARTVLWSARAVLVAMWVGQRIDP